VCSSDLKAAEAKAADSKPRPGKAPVKKKKKKADLFQSRE
jgi:hypothetical protein